MAPRHGACPGAIPGNRTNFQQVAHQPVRPSFQNSACLGQHQGDLPIFMGTWQKSDAPALQAGLSGSVTRRSPPFHPDIECRGSLRETRPKHREKPHKLLEVGVTPTPATIFREVIRLPVCKTGVCKRAGSDDWSVTSTSHQPSPAASAWQAISDS